MTRTELAILKLRKEDEWLRLQQEILELDMQLTGKSKTKQIAGIQKLRGDKCFERIMLEETLTKQEEQLIA